MSRSATANAFLPRHVRFFRGSVLRFEMPKPEDMLEQFAQSDKARVNAKRDEALAKYHDKLQARLAAHGYKNVEDMAMAKKSEAQAERAGPTQSAIEQRDAELRKKLQEKRRKIEQSKLSDLDGPKSPVQPLSSFMKLEKAIHESPENIGKLWTGFHIMKNKVSAVVPAATYAQMVATAQMFPQFVLPLPRTVKNAEADTAPEPGYEVYFLQWMPLPRPLEASPNAPPPMAVLFTSLAEYKMRQEYAQPTLVLTFYADLLETKGIALMRGDITEREDGKAQLQQQDAQLLALGLQRFFNLDWALEGLDNDEQVEKRRALLRAFHQQPADFKLDELIDVAWKI